MSRILITKAYILEANESDNNYDRFMRDTNGDPRTLGIDAFDYQTLVARTQTAIEANILDPDAWERQEQFFKTELTNGTGSNNMSYSLILKNLGA